MILLIMIYQNNLRIEKLKENIFVLTWNSTNLKKGLIKKNITRSKVNRKKMVVCDENLGRDALTEYQIKKKF